MGVGSGVLSPDIKINFQNKLQIFQHVILIDQLLEFYCVNCEFYCVNFECEFLLSWICVSLTYDCFLKTVLWL